MTDFVSELRRELVAAAARQEAGAPAVSRPRVRIRLRPLVPALAVAGLLAVAVFVAVSADRDGRRSAGPDAADTRPLFGGSLQPGVRYESHALLPPISFQVFDGRWLVTEADGPQAVVLERRERRPPGPALEPPPRSWLSFGAGPREVYDPNRPGLRHSLSPPPADLIAWLRAHPDVDAGEPRAVTVGGRDGRALDLAFSFREPRHQAPQCLPLVRGLYDRPRDAKCTTLAPGLFHLDGSRLRVYVLETEPRPLVIVLEALDDAAFRALEGPAEAVLDSLEIADG